MSPSVEKSRLDDLKFRSYALKELCSIIYWTRTNPIDINFVINGIEAFYDEFKIHKNKIHKKDMKF